MNLIFKVITRFLYLKTIIFIYNNAHKYGFILRYPKDKECITGYPYEPWHFRYVGIKLATYLYENSMTLEEYYLNKRLNNNLGKNQVRKK